MLYQEKENELQRAGEQYRQQLQQARQQARQDANAKHHLELRVEQLKPQVETLTAAIERCKVLNIISHSSLPLTPRLVDILLIP